LDRRVVGIQGDNGGEILLRILSVMAIGGLPAPFPPDIPEEVVQQCLRRLDARLHWRQGESWQFLGGEQRHLGDFDLVLHSSGSTGEPKPLAIRLEAMRRNALDVAELLNLTANDVHLGTFSHCYMSGFYNATILPLVTGGTTIAAPQATPLSIAGILDAVQSYQPTVLWLSPLIARALVTLRGISSESLANIRFAISCTAPLPGTTKAAFEEKFSRPILQSYGLCETLINTIEDPNVQVEGSVGQIVGPENAVVCDEIGQILVANGALFAGYLGDNELLLSRSETGPHATGDLGYIDARGNLFVTGRLSEVLNLDGIKISPEAIESIINSCDGILESAVIQVADNDERPHLLALVNGDSAAISDLPIYMLTAAPPHLQPREYRAVGCIPLTENGKINRRKLRQEIKH
jgi:acyl-coenzyme A synthetase/AMP-(fatty) acid ligase